MKKFALIGGCVAALLAAPTVAAPREGRPNPDANGDGLVTRAEVEASVAARFAKMDVNQDGKLDQTDREAARAKRGGEKRGMARADTNNDGAISAAEMRAVALARFDRADADKDGQLTADERAAARPQRGAGAPSPEG
jgi:EF hand